MFRNEIGMLAQLIAGALDLDDDGSRSRDRLIDEPTTTGSEDVAAELKRLRRENEILRQEREILKRAATFFAKEGS